MKFAIQQESLAAGLSMVVRAVSSRSLLPALSNVLLQANGENTLLLAASDLELGLACRVQCQVQTPGALAVPARTLADLVATLPRGELRFTRKQHCLELDCGTSKATLHGIPASEYPPQPQIETSEGLRIPAAELKAVIQRVVFAASSDESRPVLTGVLLVIEGQSVTLAAADGFRLSESRITLDAPARQSLRCIIPARALAELARIAGEAEYVQVLRPPGKGQIAFRTANCQVVSQLIEGVYPDYQQIMPRKHTTRLTADSAALLKACKQAEIFARENGKAARLRIQPGQVEIHGCSEETGSTGSIVEAVVEGPELQIAFNVAYLREALSAIRDPSVTLEATTSTSPGLLRAVGEEGYLHVIMPLHLGS
jgi:DNA polymerase-3 subunit beta